MAKQKTNETTENTTETTENKNENPTPAIVEVTVLNEHLSSPHWIELRKSAEENAANFFVEGRLHNENFGIALGAKSVETILRENGAVPMLHGDEALIIKFSPYTGEIISIADAPTAHVPAV